MQVGRVSNHDQMGVLQYIVSMKVVATVVVVVVIMNIIVIEGDKPSILRVASYKSIS